MHLIKAIESFNHEVRRRERMRNYKEFPILLKIKRKVNIPLEGYVPILWNPVKISRDELERHFTIIKEVR